MEAEIRKVTTLATQAAVCTLAAVACIAMWTTPTTEVGAAATARNRQPRRDEQLPGGEMMLFVGGPAHGDIRCIPFPLRHDSYWAVTDDEATLYRLRRVTMVVNMTARTLPVYAADGATEVQLSEAFAWAIEDGAAVIGADES